VRPDVSSCASLVWVTDQLAVGAAPLSYHHLAELHDKGISAILNLCGEFCDLADIERDHGFEVRHLPIPDEEAPDMAALEEALAWLDEAVYLGKKVYIHCRHGIGRTGTVLNAYMLRRGLGHRAAAKALSKLRSKPANFCQWRAVRRYGKASGKLTVREPQLEFARHTDLAPFLKDYEDPTDAADAAAEAVPGGLCGRDHHRCCHGTVLMTLIEAVALATAVDREFTSETRKRVMERATQAGHLELEASKELDTMGTAGEICPSGLDMACPLLEAGRCMLFFNRPLKCRVSGLPGNEAESFWRDTAPVLDKLSGQAFLALSGSFLPESPPAFSISEVVSGRYVQRFFHILWHSSRKPG